MIFRFEYCASELSIIWHIFRRETRNPSMDMQTYSEPLAGLTGSPTFISLKTNIWICLWNICIFSAQPAFRNWVQTTKCWISHIDTPVKTICLHCLKQLSVLSSQRVLRNKLKKANCFYILSKWIMIVCYKHPAAFWSNIQVKIFIQWRKCMISCLYPRGRLAFLHETIASSP